MVPNPDGSTHGSSHNSGVRAALPPGLATAIGSLPHTDASAAAALVLRLIPELPAAPELPARSAHENVIARWLRALPEVTIADDGSWYADPDSDLDAPLDCTLDPIAHAGVLAFVDLAAKQPRQPKYVKAQLTGPLTLGVALTEVGVPDEIALRRATRVARGWARSIEDLFRERLPDSQLVLFFDEPALVRWNDECPPIDHDRASDALSSAFAAVGCRTGVHVCGDGDPRVALAAGPDVLGVEVSARLLADGAGFARFLEAGGFIAWGAVPTDRPVGESAAPLWKALVELWCELTRRGCDGIRLRSQAIITPACGLAGHGVSQAERALVLTRDLAGRVFDQAAATKLTVGA
jgi:methionine synthase II (cobalamin-independent)